MLYLHPWHCPDPVNSVNVYRRSGFPPANPQTALISGRIFGDCLHFSSDAHISGAGTPRALWGTPFDRAQLITHSPTPHAPALRQVFSTDLTLVWPTQRRLKWVQLAASHSIRFCFSSLAGKTNFPVHLALLRPTAVDPLPVDPKPGLRIRILTPPFRLHWSPGPATGLFRCPTLTSLSLHSHSRGWLRPAPRARAYAGPCS